MKRTLFFCVLAVLFASCVEHKRYSTGEWRACQFVKESVPQLRQDIASVEVVGEDSLLSDIILTFEMVSFAAAGVDYLNDVISKEEYRRIIDEREQVLQDVTDSWSYGESVNDSLRELDKYRGCWRKVYRVCVTMKSGVTKSPRVLMDKDGITPRMLERDFGREVDKYQDDIRHARRNLMY